MIVRGTTPTHNFAMPFSIEDISEVIIAYVQDDEIVIEKEKGDIELDLENNIMSVQLSQEETLRFAVKDKYIDNIVLIQVRVILIDNYAYASDIIREKVADVLVDREITIGGDADV
ncbi:putative nucleic-acid-binding protein [Clostridiales Family XIII bacterium PM5-7]